PAKSPLFRPRFSTSRHYSRPARKSAPFSFFYHPNRTPASPTVSYVSFEVKRHPTLTVSSKERDNVAPDRPGRGPRHGRNVRADRVPAAQCAEGVLLSELRSTDSVPAGAGRQSRPVPAVLDADLAAAACGRRQQAETTDAGAARLGPPRWRDR